MTFAGLVDSFAQSVATSLIGLFAAGAVAAFFYGIVRYIWGIREGEERKIHEGNQFIVWGLVALFVLLSAWGIIRFVQGVFNIDSNSAIVIPEGRSAPSVPR